MLKKYLSIVFLIVLIFNMTGTFIVFKIEQVSIRKTIKHQIKAGIPENELHFFSLSAQEYEQLDWKRENKEFRKGTEMFDVVRSERSCDSVHLYCVNDKEEAILFTQLDEAVRKKMEQESNAPDSPIGKVFKIFKLVYFHDHLDNLIKNQTPTFSKTLITEINLFYLSPSLKLLTPPPNIV